MQQQGKTGHSKNKKSSGGRKLKVDYIADLNKALGTEIEGLDKCTIKTIEQLTQAVNNVSKTKNEV